MIGEGVGVWRRRMPWASAADSYSSESHTKPTPRVRAGLCDTQTCFCPLLLTMCTSAAQLPVSSYFCLVFILKHCEHSLGYKSMLNCWLRSNLYHFGPHSKLWVCTRDTMQVAIKWQDSNCRQQLHWPSNDHNSLIQFNSWLYFYKLTLEKRVHLEKSVHKHCQ